MKHNPGINHHAKVSRLKLRSKLSSFMPTFSESRRMRNVPEVMQKIVDMGFHKDKESREERNEKIQQAKANYKRASKEMPKRSIKRRSLIRRPRRDLNLCWQISGS